MSYLGDPSRHVMPASVDSIFIVICRPRSRRKNCSVLGVNVDVVDGLKLPCW
jgi:hypothetical protein